MNGKRIGIDSLATQLVHHDKDRTAEPMENPFDVVADLQIDEQKLLWRIVR